jgi:hypothetical protein
MINWVRSSSFQTCFAALVLSALAYGQAQVPAGRAGGPAVPGGGRAEGQGQPAGRGGPGGMTPQKPAIPNVKPVRSCESLASLRLPNTTITLALHSRPCLGTDTAFVQQKM